MGNLCFVTTYNVTLVCLFFVSLMSIHSLLYLDIYIFKAFTNRLF